MKALKWINTGAFVSMIVVNALAELLPIGGRMTGQISELYPNLFTPAPITFAIWGLIYLLLLFFTLFQHGIMDGGRYSTKAREKIGVLFCVSCVLNILWIFFWHYQQIGWSTICIAALMIVLGVIVGRVDDMQGSRLQYVTTKAGFSLYFGWIIAATIANISVWLTARGWNGWGIGAEIWTVIVLFVGAAIAGVVAVFRKNWIAAIAVMWAYAGILIRHISPVYLAGRYPYVIAAAIVSEVLILSSTLLPMLVCKYRSRIAIACEAAPDQ